MSDPKNSPHSCAPPIKMEPKMNEHWSNVDQDKLIKLRSSCDLALMAPNMELRLIALWDAFHIITQLVRKVSLR